MASNKVHSVKANKARPPASNRNRGELSKASIKPGEPEAAFNGVNKNRRNFIKFLLAGSGVLLLGRLFGPRFLEFFSDATTENTFAGFRVTQKGKDLTIYDRTGEAIFIIDDKKE